MRLNMIWEYWQYHIDFYISRMTSFPSAWLSFPYTAASDSLTRDYHDTLSI